MHKPIQMDSNSLSLLNQILDKKNFETATKIKAIKSQKKLHDEPVVMKLGDFGNE